MLSYRHAYHAGNFADVLKHTVLLHCLGYMTQKDKPLRVIDTHAGAGHYVLSGAHSLKNREFDTGIGQLWQQSECPPMVADYVAAVRACNPDGRLSQYPGSPLLALAQLRPSDKLFLHELHSTDCRLLKETLGSDRRVKIVEEDGFAGLQALLPPPERRALVLIDPSYEIKSDYRHLVQQLQQAHRRFASGTFAIWYPVVQRGRIDELERSLSKSGIRNIQLFELGIAPDSPEPGMTASGMILINPPWTLWSALEPTLPWLAQCLGGEQGHYRQVQLVAE